MSTMRAVVYHGKEDVRVERVPIPECGPGELRVKIDACAVCGSDYKTYKSGNPRMKPPITMGHEFTGLVETVGGSVEGFRKGDRIVMATSISCGECVYCRRGWSNLCVKLDPMGFSYPGGMAEYVVIPQAALRNGHVITVPPEVPAECAALAEPFSCAVNAAENCAIAKGDTVVVVGAGPLGIMNLYVAGQYGAAKCILAERESKRLEQARAFPCDRLVDAGAENLVEVVRAETGGVGADVVIVAAPDASAQEQALDFTRKKGKVCLFASLPVGKNMLSIDSRKIHYGELMILGSSDSTPAQVRKAVTLLSKKGSPAAKLATPILALDGIAEAFRVMEARDGMRVVLKP